MEDEPINQNYLIGCDTIEHSPSIDSRRFTICFVARIVGGFPYIITSSYLVINIPV